MIEKWVNFKRDYLEISFLREKWMCAISPYHRRYVYTGISLILKLNFPVFVSIFLKNVPTNPALPYSIKFQK